MNHLISPNENEEKNVIDMLHPDGSQRGLAEVYKAGQTPWVELTPLSCFRESWMCQDMLLRIGDLCR